MKGHRELKDRCRKQDSTIAVTEVTGDNCSQRGTMF